MNKQFVSITLLTLHLYSHDKQIFNGTKNNNAAHILCCFLIYLFFVLLCLGFFGSGFCMGTFSDLTKSGKTDKSSKCVNMK